MPMWYSVSDYANYKRENELSFVVLLTRDLPKCCQWLAVINNDANWCIKYQRDFQAERMGNSFRQQLRSDAIPSFFPSQQNGRFSIRGNVMLASLLA